MAESGPGIHKIMDSSQHQTYEGMEGGREGGKEGMREGRRKGGKEGRRE